MKVSPVVIIAVLALLAILAAIVLPVIGTIDTRERMEHHRPLTVFDRLTVNDRVWRDYPLAYGRSNGDETK